MKTQTVYINLEKVIRQMSDEKEKITVRDFKKWLKGVEDMMGDEWAPSVDQWIKIREQIGLLEQEAPIQRQSEYVPPIPGRPPINTQPVAGSSLDIPAPSLRPPAPAVANPNKGAPMVQDGATTITPNLEAGEYNTPFQ